MSDIDFPISSSIPPNSPPSSPPSHIQRISAAGPTTTVDLPPQSPPSALPQSNENENETPQPTQGKETATIPRPAFSTPFFTLIHDVGTESTIHPTRVHYIFSDDTDGHEVLSGACIRALEGNNNNLSASDGLPKHGLGIGGAELQSSSSSSATYKKSSGKEKEKGKENEGKRREERVLILDLDETGSNVVKASSLSANWQILDTEIGNAPTFDGSVDSEEENGGEGKGMMLRIEGVGAEGFGFGGLAGFGGDEEDEGEEASEERMHALVERFEGRMKELRRVVEFGGLEGFVEGEGEEGRDEGEDDVGKGADDVAEKRKKGSSEETAVRVG